MHRTAAGVCLAGLALVCAGCGPGAVTVADSPGVHAEGRRACRTLVRALPDTVADRDRREVAPPEALGAAWGDPPIVLRCGVRMPAAFTRFSRCQVADGVGWFAPQAQAEDQSLDAVLTTVGRTPNVELSVPARYRPPTAALVDVATAIKQSLPVQRRCR